MEDGPQILPPPTLEPISRPSSTSTSASATLPQLPGISSLNPSNGAASTGSPQLRYYAPPTKGAAVRKPWYSKKKKIPHAHLGSMISRCPGIAMRCRAKKKKSFCITPRLTFLSLPHSERRTRWHLSLLHPRHTTEPRLRPRLAVRESIWYVEFCYPSTLPNLPFICLSIYPLRDGAYLAMRRHRMDGPSQPCPANRYAPRLEIASSVASPSSLSPMMACITCTRHSTPLGLDLIRHFS
ncbi:hypothetical protein B0I35DRAFT_14429 [Stachybotrys elegans]|uniref:Uncharacterized protein n=1 Tax=Stachybotrys elegans TaxID=80388 RepID=A0A8K0T126_9HYPO|nr:hypothetical protein B0I35DRAFT_14429 [Stachybotrys elegans]